MVAECRRGRGVSFEKLLRTIAIASAFEIHWRTQTPLSEGCTRYVNTEKALSLYANGAFLFLLLFYFFFMITPYGSPSIFTTLVFLLYSNFLTLACIVLKKIKNLVWIYYYYVKMKKKKKQNSRKFFFLEWELRFIANKIVLR